MKHGLMALALAGLLAAVPAQRASAYLVTLEVSGSVGCTANSQETFNCPAFSADTGFCCAGTAGGPFTADFTIETSPSPGSIAAGTGLTVTIGNWIEVLNSLQVELSPQPHCSMFDSAYTGGDRISIRAAGPSALFGDIIDNCPTGQAGDLAPYTLDVLATAPLDDFKGRVDSIPVYEGGINGSDWVAKIFNNSTIRRVPEPGTLALLGLGLAGLGFTRRRKA